MLHSDFEAVQNVISERKRRIYESFMRVNDLAKDEVLEDYPEIYERYLKSVEVLDLVKVMLNQNQVG